jgi:hypothetical protein
VIAKDGPQMVFDLHPAIDRAAVETDQISLDRKERGHAPRIPLVPSLEQLLKEVPTRVFWRLHPVCLS